MYSLFVVSFYLHVPFFVPHFRKLEEITLFSVHLDLVNSHFDPIITTNCRSRRSISLRIIHNIHGQIHTILAESLIKTELLLIMWNVIFLPIVIPVSATVIFVIRCSSSQPHECQIAYARSRSTFCKYHTKSDCNTCTFNVIICHHM